MAPVILLTNIIIISFYITRGLSISARPKLLVISYDAFRYDYFDRNLTPFMKQLKEEGTYVDYMMNIFITKTFPNHHTMATGLFAETHGVVDNNIIDEKGNVLTAETYETFHYSNSVLPIWTVNEKAGGGRHSGTMMWPGCKYKYQGVAPFFTQPYNHTIPWKQRIDTLMSWFTHPTNPINFGVLYIEEPDFHGHFTGINNDAFNDILVQLDNITVYLHDQLEKNGLKDINIVHLSDHGMASVTIDRIINLTNYINNDDYKFVGTSPGLHIYPNPGKEEEIYQKLKAASKLTKHFTVYKKEEIPKKYHYGDNPRVGPIFVLAEVGYAFQNLLEAIEYYKQQYNITVDSKSEFGLHGYKNEAVEMHPIFFAKGPAFLPKCKLEPFDNIDLFPLFCKILQLECPSVNGTVSHFSKCLRVNADEEEWMRTYRILLMGVGSTMVIVTLIGLIIFTTIKSRYTRLNHRFYYDISE